jgi:cell wall-associated NlpC family hydrolase
MNRLRLRHAASLLALVAAVGAVSVPSAKADPLASARAQASALAKTVTQLQTRAEVATERYDGIEAQLGVAVSKRAVADQNLQGRQAAAARAQQSIVDRASAIYESGGDSALLASLISGGSPADAVSRFTLASSVMSYERASADQATRAVAQATARDARDSSAATQVTRLQTAASRAAVQVQTLLTANQQALKSANGTVRRILKANQAAAAAAQAADFAAAVGSAGGTINGNDSTTPPNKVAAAAIAAAHSRLGVPYVWGATGPDAFDCSGLTQWSYAHAGITLPRVAAAQWGSGPHPSLSQLEPGDLLFWALDVTNPATIHHVAMYVGHGLMIAAPHTGENVQIQAVYMQGFIGATRPWATTITPTTTAP